MTTVMVRAATAESVAGVVRACSPESVRRRFTVGRAPDPDEVLTRYGRFLLAGLALVAERDGVSAGLLNVVPDGERRAELGLLVADPWQRQGIGRALVGLVIGASRWRGWTVHATVQSGNEAAEGLLRACGFRLLPEYGWSEQEFEYVVGRAGKETSDGGAPGPGSDGLQRCATAAYAGFAGHRDARSGGACRGAARVASALLPRR
ncbi:GNAT family N-acetyltransferase [Amycolatopsis sulphurea]|uniref:GNAT family N-acetyltransferase n=1 Tax=Amycolatopsis sulphurea TaxID=76022 RepID=UPI001FE56FE7|nr:GNAT family N-acetyltransferase [Amycolatopsis sulphurea]